MEQYLTIGQQLKAKREELGLTIDDIASQTYIQKFNLQALEDDAFDRIDGEVYIKGFLGQYAGALKLNSKEILTHYHNQVSQLKPEKPVEKSAKKQVQSKNKTLSIITSIVILSSIIGLVLFLGTEDEDQVEKRSVSLIEPTKNEIPVKTTNLEIISTQNSTLTSQTVNNKTLQKNEITDSTWPSIPKNGAKVTLQSRSVAILEVTIDNLPTTRYRLTEGSEIEWHPNNSAHFSAIQKGDLVISMNNMMLEFNVMGIIDLIRE